MTEKGIKKNTGLAILFGSLGIAYFLLSRFFANGFNYLPKDKILYLPVVILVTALSLFVLYKYLFQSKWLSTIMPLRNRLLVLALLFCVPLLVIIPPPVPATDSSHQLIIQALEQNNTGFSQTSVQLLKLRYLDGTSIPSENITISPDWSAQGNALISNGSKDSRLVIAGAMPGGGVILNVRYSVSGGSMLVNWDGETKLINLTTYKEHVNYPMVLESKVVNLNLQSITIRLLACVLYAFGLFEVILTLNLILISLFGNKYGIKVLDFLYYLVLIFIIVYLKYSYLSFDIPRAFNDTLDYIKTAGEPVTSSTFWFGLRPFGYPLFLKLNGVTVFNYYTNAKMTLIENSQTFFSAACWVVLSFTLSRLFKNSISRKISFGLLLFFCTSLEISLWDTLLLSESLSISIFTLLISCWIWLFCFMPNRHRNIYSILIFVFLTLVSIIFIFTRDTNLIYILICCILFMFISLLLPRPKKELVYSRGYFFLMVSVVIFQYLSFASANRWQIFIYDNLALRLLEDPNATDYFVQHGMPINEEVRSIPTLHATDYQTQFIYNAEFHSLREWVNCCSVPTYLQFLISHPGYTFWAPVRDYALLLNGINLEYRYPKDGVWPVSKTITRLSNIFYAHTDLSLLLIFVIGCIGLGIAFHRGNRIWIIMIVMILPIIPLMSIIWHAEAMEIERHANQIGIQLRLFGWIGVAVLLDEIFSIGASQLCTDKILSTTNPERTMK